MLDRQSALTFPFFALCHAYSVAQDLHALSLDLRTLLCYAICALDALFDAPPRGRRGLFQTKRLV